MDSETEDIVANFADTIGPVEDAAFVKIVNSDLEVSHFSGLAGLAGNSRFRFEKHVS